MADIATQIWMTIERRLTSIEHRLDALEKAKKPDRQLIDWQKHLPRLWRGLLVAGLVAAGILPPETAKKIVFALF